MKTADISRRKSLRAHTKLWRIVLAFAGLYATASNASDIVEYPIRTPNAQPMGISVGPDGKIWFAEAGVNKLGHVLSTGTIAETAIPEGNDVYDLALGPDSALWIAEPVHFAIGRWAPLAFDAFSLTTRTPTRS
ncbi:MAG TPA: hypothetical protein VF132_01625, partial [Rudaea sp.]